MEEFLVTGHNSNRIGAAENILKDFMANMGSSGKNKKDKKDKSKKQ